MPVRPILAVVLALPILPAGAAGAQPVPGMVQSVERTMVADDLSRHLRTLAASPENLEAAIGAGDAALALGDANAAAGFFARAEQLSARDPRPKAGLARAFLALERPRDALRLFDDAVELGAPSATIARDRGLAYDLRGDQRRAQRDYRLALQSGRDDEVTRRLALSLGISGEREQALALLDPLLYERDASAWRARAFVMAIDGDLPAAMEIVRQVMPPQQAATMEPYLRRLESLRDSQQAQAVHLGRFPQPAGAGSRSAAARRPAATRTPPRPGSGAAAVAAANAQMRERIERAAGAAGQPATTPAGGEAPVLPVRLAAATPVANGATAPAPVASGAAAPPRAPASPPPAGAPSSRAVAGDPPAAAEPAAYRGRRVWVQVASGARAAMPREWQRLRGRAGAALDGREAYLGGGGAGTRLLVGPFDTAAAARTLVAELGAAGVSSFAWTSGADAEIGALP